MPCLENIPEFRIYYIHMLEPDKFKHHISYPPEINIYTHIYTVMFNWKLTSVLLYCRI